MEQLKTLRKQLGLSQKDFSDLIGCNPGQLAMAEANLRKLPADGNTLLLLFQNYRQPAKTAKAKPAPPTQNKAVTLLLNKMVKGVKIKLVRQQLLAEAFESKIETATNMIAFAAANIQKKQPPLTRMQLVVLQRQAREKLSRYQQKLISCLLQIAGFEAVINKAGILKNN